MGNVDCCGFRTKFANEMRAPTSEGMATDIMDSGNGADSIDCVKECLKPFPDSKVLELGPGSGWATREILAAGSTVHAVEISEVWVANKRYEISKFKFKFPRARIYEIIGLVLGCIEATFCK